MRLAKLSLRQFRNIQDLEISPGPSLNFLVGDNAQGKTSILESIYFLSTLKSFRPAKLLDLTKSGFESFQVEAEISSDLKDRVQRVKVRVQGLQKRLLVDEKPVIASKFRSNLRVVIFSPDSLAAVKYGPELRRELIDQAFFQISTKAGDAQEEYGRALRQRNACLKQIKNGLIDLGQGRKILESLEPGFLRLASEVTFYRLELLDALRENVIEIISQIMGTTVNIAFAYESDDRIWSERDYSSIQSRLERSLKDEAKRKNEEVLGLSLVGPHRHDLSFIFNNADSRIYCSQGQQRALILSFKMAEIVYHGKAFVSHPLLLLDDVLSEFDEAKRRYLVDFLSAHEAQTFLTTTDRTLILEGCPCFQIKAGKLIN